MAVVFFVLSASASSSRGEPPDRDAEYRAAFIEGRTRFAAGEFAAARAAFQRAYEIRSTPMLVFNIGSTYRREGNLEKAAHYYQRYLDEGGPDAELRDLALRTVAEIRKELAVKRTARPHNDRLVLQSSAESRDRAPSGRGWKIAGIGVATVGVAALGWGAYEGHRARRAADELRALDPGTRWSREHQDTHDRGTSAERRAALLLSGGGMAAVAGITLYVIGHRRADTPERRSITLVPAAGPGLHGMVVRGDF